MINLNLLYQRFIQIMKIKIPTLELKLGPTLLIKIILAIDLQNLLRLVKLQLLEKIKIL
jgi:hypothetical protein